MTRFKVGDEVFARLPECHRGNIYEWKSLFYLLVTNARSLNSGAWSELAKTTEDFVALKPNSLSMEDSASIPLAAMTALQALRGYPGTLEGKTVFVPAGCMFPPIYTVVQQKLTLCGSEWYRTLRLPVGQECIQGWESHHHRFNFQGSSSEGTFG